MDDVKELSESLGKVLNSLPEKLAQDIANRDALDAARYRWLMVNAVGMAPETRDGPPHPVLEFYADIFNERPHQTPQFRITRKIDAAMKEAK